MKKTIIFIAIFGMSLSLWAENHKDTLSLGYKLEDINNNLGINVDIVSPTVLNYFNIRLSGGFELEAPTLEEHHNRFLLGLRGYGQPVNDVIKLYGEAGYVVIKDKDSYYFGGYGLFGFEFYTATDYKSPVSYFIEMGAHSCNEPLFSGFTSSVGFRYYF